MINPIMSFLLKGMNNCEIATSLNISLQAVKHRKSRLFWRMQVHNSTEAVAAYLLPLNSLLRNKLITYCNCNCNCEKIHTTIES